MSAHIGFQNVKEIYKTGEVEIQALAGVDFVIDKGEFVAVAGAGGAGKGIVLDTLGGMDSSTSGDIFVDGTGISKSNAKQLTTYQRYGIGSIFRFYNLVRNLTVKENAGLATRICKQLLNTGEATETVELKERASNFPAQLSGGEQQHTTIACALVKNPKLLLCGESAGVLDYNTGKQILKLLQNTCRQRGVSVVVITHNLVLTVMGDRVIEA